MSKLKTLGVLHLELIFIRHSHCSITFTGQQRQHEHRAGGVPLGAEAEP